MPRRALLAIPLLALACSHSPTLTLTSRDHAHVLTQPFTLAAMTPPAPKDSPIEDFDIVLVAQGTEDSLSDTNPKDNLTPVAAPPIRQVVHLKLHWRPYPGSGPDNPASSNATIRWLLYPSSGLHAPTTDVVEYSGTAFVKPSFSDGGCTFTLRAGELRPTAVRGRMTDALGPSTFSGKFFAPYSTAVVQSVLKDLPTEMAK